MTLSLDGLTKQFNDSKERIIKLEELRSSLETQIRELHSQAESLKREVELKETLLKEVKSSFSEDISQAKVAKENNKALSEQVLSLETKKAELEVDLRHASIKIKEFEHQRKNAQMSSRTSALPSSGSPNDMIEYLTLKVNKLEGMLKCGVCNNHYKEVVLSCNHMFCKECIDRNIESRYRMCPMDRSKINKADVRTLIWGANE